MIILIVIAIWLGLGYVGGRCCLMDTDSIGGALAVTALGVLGYIVAWFSGPETMFKMHGGKRFSVHPKQIVYRFFCVMPKENDR